LGIATTSLTNTVDEPYICIFWYHQSSGLMIALFGSPTYSELKYQMPGLPAT